MREEKSVEAKWQLGDGYNVALAVETLDRGTLSNSRMVKSSDLIFRVNFWRDGEKPFFRVDTDNGFLHFHLLWNEKKVADHVPLPEGEFSISQLISNAFEATRDFLSAKGAKILKGSDFAGFA